MTPLFLTFISAFLGFMGALFMARYAGVLGLVDLPNVRSSHSQPTPRGGGIGILIAVFICLVALSFDWMITGAATFLSLLSFFDDKLDLTAKFRLVAQALAAFVAVAATLEFVSLGLGSVVFFVFLILFVVGTTNFYNFMDGINGIAAFIGVVSFGLLAGFCSLHGDNVHWLYLCVAVSAACVGFLPLNFPRAKVFMGDVGSILLGFLFAVVVINVSSGLNDFVCLQFFLFMFYADCVSTLFIRWRDGEPLSQAHRRHLYQLLVNEIGLTHRKVTLIYALLQLVSGMIMLVAWQNGFIWEVAWFIACSLLYLWFMAYARGLAAHSFARNQVQVSNEE